MSSLSSPRLSPLSPRAGASAPAAGALGCALVACAGLASFAGCAEDDDPDPLQRAEQALAARGLDALRTQLVVADGKRFDHLEAYAPTGARGFEQLTYSSEVSIDLGGRAQRGTWSSTTVEVFPGTHREWTEVSAGQRGYVVGNDGGFPPAGAAGAPMLSSRVAARWKERALMTPAYLVAQGLAHREQVETLPEQRSEGHRYQVVAIAGIDGWPAPVRLWLDPDTGLPARAETTEDDPVYGDVTLGVRYDDWRQAGVTLAPFSLQVSLAGEPLLEERRSAVVDNPMLAEDAFAVPAEREGSYDAELDELGRRSSAYFLRTQEYGAAGYADAGRAVRSTPLVTTPGAQIVLYDAAGYNTLAIELGASIFVAEAPLYDSVSTAVLADIGRRWPGKPIKYVASTHFHYDHSGGVRTYAAAGATVLAPIETADFYRAMLAAPHTLAPDTLARAPRAVKVTAVGDLLTLTGGGRTVTVYNVTQSHSAGALVVYVEDAKLLFTSDLYNPGFNNGPVQGGPDAPFHDLYARELVRALTDLGLSQANLTTFVGGHGGTGTWAELRQFGGL